MSGGSIGIENGSSIVSSSSTTQDSANSGSALERAERKPVGPHFAALPGPCVVSALASATSSFTVKPEDLNLLLKILESDGRLGRDGRPEILHTLLRKQMEILLTNQTGDPEIEDLALLKRTDELLSPGCVERMHVAERAPWFQAMTTHLFLASHAGEWNGQHACHFRYAISIIKKTCFSSDQVMEQIGAGKSGINQATLQSLLDRSTTPQLAGRECLRFLRMVLQGEGQLLAATRLEMEAGLLTHLKTLSEVPRDAAMQLRSIDRLLLPEIVDRMSVPKRTEWLVASADALQALAPVTEWSDDQIVTLRHASSILFKTFNPASEMMDQALSAEILPTSVMEKIHNVLRKLLGPPSPFLSDYSDHKSAIAALATIASTAASTESPQYRNAFRYQIEAALRRAATLSPDEYQSASPIADDDRDLDDFESPVDDSTGGTATMEEDIDSGDAEDFITADPEDGVPLEEMTDSIDDDGLYSEAGEEEVLEERQFNLEIDDPRNREMLVEAHDDLVSKLFRSLHALKGAEVDGEFYLELSRKWDIFIIDYPYIVRGVAAAREDVRREFLTDLLSKAGMFSHGEGEAVAHAHILTLIREERFLRDNDLLDSPFSSFEYVVGKIAEMPRSERREFRAYSRSIFTAQTPEMRVLKPYHIEVYETASLLSACSSLVRMREGGPQKIARIMDLLSIYLPDSDPDAAMFRETGTAARCVLQHLMGMSKRRQERFINAGQEMVAQSGIDHRSSQIFLCLADHLLGEI